MAIRDLTSERLYLVEGLRETAEIELGENQSHYLAHVLRMSLGARVLLFNGRDGEWAASIISIKKRSVTLSVLEQTRPQVNGRDIDYLFAPLKRSRLDYMVQKATEMGVRRLRPVMTERTLAERVRIERMQANVIEAAEQCGILEVPTVMEPAPLTSVIDAWDDKRPLIFCDEAASGDPLATLRDVSPGSIAVIVGPEGGFSPRERDGLLARKYVVPISLGPRIMRADTAAVAVLALVNAVLGDWRHG